MSEARRIVDLNLDDQIDELSILKLEDIVQMCQASNSFNNLCKNNNIWNGIIAKKYNGLDIRTIVDQPDMKKVYFAYTSVINGQNPIDLKGIMNNFGMLLSLFIGDDKTELIIKRLPHQDEALFVRSSYKQTMTHIELMLRKLVPQIVIIPGRIGQIEFENLSDIDLTRFIYRLLKFYDFGVTINNYNVFVT